VFLPTSFVRLISLSAAEMAPKRSGRRGKRSQKKKDDTRKSCKSQEEGSEEEFVVEAILDEKPNGTVLVKWEGYNEATWEPVEAMPASVIKRFRAKLKSGTQDQALPKSDKDQVRPRRNGKSPENQQKRKRVSLDKSGSDGSEFSVQEEDSDEASDEALKKLSAPKKVNRSLKLQATATNSKPLLKVNSTRSVCVVCKEVEIGGRKCATCMKPVHHMCSNEVAQALAVEEFGETCYCSKSCYQATQVKSKPIARTPIVKKIQQKGSSKI
jgi:hypothetical protein